MTAVSAVVVTRGDVDLAPILDSLPFDDIVVWDNSQREDLAVYGRYVAIAEAKHPTIFCQDDDCLLTSEALMQILDAYEPGRLVANMPAGRWPDYPDSALVGWGAIFDRDLPEWAFERFHTSTSIRRGTVGSASLFRAEFYRTCDVVFSALTPRTVIDVGFQHLPWAEDPGRAMFLQPGHKTERDRMLDICRRVRTWDDDDRRTA